MLPDFYRMYHPWYCRNFIYPLILRLSVAIIRTMYPKKYMMNFMILLMGQDSDKDGGVDNWKIVKM